MWYGEASKLVTEETKETYFKSGGVDPVLDESGRTFEMAATECFQKLAGQGKVDTTFSAVQWQGAGLPKT